MRNRQSALGQDCREDYFGVLYRGKRVGVLVLLEEEYKRESHYRCRMHELACGFLKRFDESGDSAYESMAF